MSNNILKQISDDVGEINVTLAKQEITLREHIRRTALIEKELVPIKIHVNQVNGALKLIGLVGILVGIGVSLGRMLSLF